MQHPPLTIIMIALLTTLMLSCPLSSVLAEGEKTDAFHNMAVKLLCDFFGLPNRPSDKDRSDKDRDEGDYCNLTGNESSVTHGGKQYHVEYLIATIADPTDSRLDYLFDRNLDDCVPPFTRGVLGHEISLVLGQALRPLVHDHS